MTFLISLLIGFLGISFLVAFHEFGHFLFARLFGVDCPTFSIGFGPKILEKKIAGTTFALSAIPLGGYVEMAGNQEIGQGEQLQAHRRDEHTLAAKSYWQKMVIIFGGIFMNLLFAVLALAFLFWLGAPAIGSLAQKEKPVLGSIRPNSAAQKANLKPGDTIIAVNQEPVATIEEFTKKIEPFADQQVTLSVDRKGISQDLPVTLGSQQMAGKKFPQLGVYFIRPALGFVDSIKEGFNATWTLITSTFGALASLRHGTQAVGGPVMLISQIAEGATMGFKVFLFLLAFISINLAVLNVIPLPIFDGGQALFFTIEAILRRPLSDELRYKIHYYSWLLVMALVVYLTFKDLNRLTRLKELFTWLYQTVKNFFVKAS